MITFEEAFRIVTESSFRLGREVVSLSEAAGRALTLPVRSDMDMPPWNKSAVDGYACRHTDLGHELTVLETVAAGVMPQKEVVPGTCSRIMTGAAVPAGADYVFMLEDSEELSDGRVKFTGRAGNDNIAKAGEDIMKDQTVLRSGHYIKPQDVAVLASVGAMEVTVSCRPRIGVISTGDELVEPDIVPAGAQIRNSNASQLMAQIARAGARGKYYGIARDDVESITSLLKKALEENDVVLISGGVSFGDFDLVPRVMRSLGLTIHFDQVAMQPGKPLTFCTGDKKAVFGLPGNPVSVFVQFEVMVRAFLDRMAGVSEQAPVLQMPLAADYSRKKAERMSWIPCTITAAGEALPVEYHGSAHISALTGAWGVIIIPRGQSWIQKGEMVSVRQV
ncbi:MAG TPA: molybdopterin molybdotransferase MoeA [Bacteroidales bacterium]|jgi:molybdopterin molybdotransferase|nr:molybdopterin molybdotransferase MoeA [Bacteroidales bacterium]HNX85159.1 molybdopterin molybdotransferase MoeA [Bacteroidales bacterium]